MTTRIAVALFEDAEELDWAGPYEVLSSWAQHWPGDDIEVFTIAQFPHPVRGAKGLVVVPKYTWTTAPGIDVLVYPGGVGTRREMKDETVTDWVKERANAGTLMTSVCTGALVYGAAGLLKGRPATTFWGAIDELRQVDSSIHVKEDARWVDDGDVITAAGVSAGIDMALHLVARLHSEERAREVRRAIQYDPEPPV